MKEIVKFFKENQIQFLSTTGLDGKPKVRPFQFMLEQEGKLYFCTSNTKNVFQELKKNSDIEVSAVSQKFEWIRLSGSVIFSNDITIKSKIIEANQLVKSIYKTADNPVFEIFYIENGKAVVSDFSGNPPKEFLL